MTSLFNKSKRKVSAESPNDGQKETKQNKMSTSPNQVFNQGEHERDIIASLHIIMSEIRDLKTGQLKITKTITQQIDLRQELKSEIKTRIDHSEIFFRNKCLLLNACT